MSHKIKEAAYFITSNNPGIMAFLETKIKSKNLHKIIISVWRQADFLSNNNVVFEGRILVLWDKNWFEVKLIKDSDQLLSCWCRCISTNEDYILSIVYARNLASQREDLQSNLKSLFNSFSCTWLVMGDFNCIRFANEKLGGNLMTPKVLNSFNSCLSCCKP